MSKHYTAYQYEPAYQPKALRNWEVPHYYCNKPRRRTGRTRVISNNVGNLLPGIPRPKTTPWGNYIGTWHLPRRIDRKLADILNGTAQLEAEKEKCRRHLLTRRKMSEDLEVEAIKEKKPEPAKEPEKEKEVEKPAATEAAEPASAEVDKDEAKPEVRICPIHGPF